MFHLGSAGGGISGTGIGGSPLELVPVPVVVLKAQYVDCISLEHSDISVVCQLQAGQRH